MFQKLLLTNYFPRILGRCQPLGVLQMPQLCQHVCFYTKKMQSDYKPQVVLSEDKSMFMCWHPHQPFPYECSKPIPRREAEIQEGDSVLKVQYLLEDKYRYREDGPTTKELNEMFFTTHHKWRPRPGKRKAQPRKHDRDGI